MTSRSGTADTVDSQHRQCNLVITAGSDLCSHLILLCVMDVRIASLYQAKDPFVIERSFTLSFDTVFVPPDLPPPNHKTRF